VPCKDMKRKKEEPHGGGRDEALMYQESGRAWQMKLEEMTKRGLGFGPTPSQKLCLTAIIWTPPQRTSAPSLSLY